ncbi:NUDIX hydrolase [Arthrobacter rhombi]|uniref:NUDIX hydrolase n=1 Tax=Arthrobacter rhombi TaxID=71253 RepID=UPI003FD242C6
MSTAPREPDTGFDTRLAAYCVVVRHSKILLALWDMRSRWPGFTPRWTLPGGGVELGEAIEDGAVREVSEETGYDVRLTGLLDVDAGHIPAESRFHPTHKPLQNVAVLYSAEITGGELEFEVDGTTSQAGWFDLEELSRLERTSRVDWAVKAHHHHVDGGRP